MKNLFIIFASALFALSLTAHAEELKTIRGAAIDSTTKAEVKDSVLTGREANPNVFNQHEVEPSMIPHDISGYTIDAKQNMCLMCHKDGIGGSTKLPESHLTDDRSGEVTEDVDGRRYFCTQCHSPQVDSEPIIKNKSYE